MNGFLAALDNTASAPINPSSQKGNVTWPSPFAVRTYTSAEKELNARLFGNCPTRLVRFAKAIQLLWAVEDSLLSSSIADYDRIITYDRAQLTGQLADIDAAYRTATADALRNMQLADPSRVLSDELLRVWQGALTPVDRLSAVIVHFGTRDV